MRRSGASVAAVRHNSGTIAIDYIRIMSWFLPCHMGLSPDIFYKQGMGKTSTLELGSWRSLRLKMDFYYKKKTYNVSISRMDKL